MANIKATDAALRNHRFEKHGLTKMTLASETWTWSEDGRLFSRLTTNVPSRLLLAKLTSLGLLELVETVHAYFDDRVYGGNGYEILWKVSTRLNDLENLARL